jgi:hypothetical protein
MPAGLAGTAIHDARTLGFPAEQIRARIGVVVQHLEQS